MKKPLEAADSLSAQQAMAEASRCLFCFDAPCAAACPAGIDVAGFIRRIRSGNFAGAHRLIWEQNILGGVCGRACPTEHLCEEACSRTELARPIEIGALQSFACSHDLLLEEKLRRPSGPKVAVIGAGPAGLAAAADLARRGYRPTIFEKETEAGGQVRWAILEPKLPSGLVGLEVRRLKDMGVSFRFNVRSLKSLAPSKLKKEGFKAVFLGIGLPQNYRLGVSGEDLEGVEWGRDLLNRFARAATARERRSIKAGRRTVVVGGGNVAIDTAKAAVRAGASKVVVVCLEGPTEMPAYESEIRSAWSMGVEFLTRARLTRILGNPRNRVHGVEGLGIEWKVPGKCVPSNAVDVAGTEFKLPADRVFLAVGQCPDLSVAELFKVAVNRRGLIKIKAKSGETSVPWVFAGGDAVSGGATVVQAVCDGKRASAGLDKFLRPKGRGGTRRG